uniref:UDP-glucose 4-epimerase n=1 Tax=Tetraselmis sp. GSL018 TaxID=582737 RepID=A0A061S7J8_9CHLO
MKELAGSELSENVTLEKVDLLDAKSVERIFSEHRFSAVVHFAGLKAVGESVEFPMLYYTNNFVGTTNLVQLMSKYNCKNLVFSSSCTVYGNPRKLPIDEKHPLGPISPYGRSKTFIEEMLRDLCGADKEWRVILLRYFNPIANHPTGRLGESPVDSGAPPNNLLPYIQQVVSGRREALTVFGTDYNTVDGTPVRDYIHVMDLAEGHTAALRKVLFGPWKDSDPGCVHYNLGTGVGSSVLQVIKACERACGRSIPYVLADRRPGDAEIVYAATGLAERELDWTARYNLDDMCTHMWAWMQQNPNGYAS